MAAAKLFDIIENKYVNLAELEYACCDLCYAGIPRKFWVIKGSKKLYFAP